MKRIPNTAAVRTICRLMNGLQDIRICDYDNGIDLSFRKNGRIEAFGALNDLRDNPKYRKLFDAKCEGIDVVDGVIFFHVCTAFEEY